MSDAIFHRKELAIKMADRICSQKSASGLFLSAPRRTGKSTFIKEDLLPVLTQEGAEVIYVDLWSDKCADPGDLITSAIQKHIAGKKSAIVKWAEASGIDSVSLNIGGISVVSKGNSGSPHTLSSLLSELSDATKSLVILVIDEAQHAATTENGSNTLFALKAARDELNRSVHYGFRLVATGSNRDKLGLLVSSKAQAFYCAPIMELPHLDRPFLEWKAMELTDATPTIDALTEAFRLCEYKPEYLSAAIDSLEFQLDLNASNVNERLLGEVKRRNEESRRVFLKEINVLPVIQASVLRVAAIDADDFSPFGIKSIERYKKICTELTDDEIKIDTSQVQYALEALREKSLMWKSSRGVYTIEDPQYVDWLTELGEPEAS